MGWIGWAILALLVAAFVLAVLGRWIDSGPGSADERLASVIPRLLAIALFVLAVVLALIAALLRLV